MGVPDETRRIVQEWLAAHPVDRALLAGPVTRERNESLTKIVIHTYRRMRRGMDWREWVLIQAEVKQAVDELIEELRCD